MLNGLKRIGLMLGVSLLLTSCGLFQKTIVSDWCISYQFVGLTKIEASLLPKEIVEVIDMNDIDYLSECTDEILD